MKECREELLGRVRRGQAWGQDRAAFEAHLETCESCRMTLDLMGDFDAVGEAEPGDSERVARIAAAAAAALGASTPPPVRPLRAPHRHWRLAIAALVITGSAVAGGLGWIALRSSPARETNARPTTPATSGRGSPSITPRPVATEKTPDNAEEEAVVEPTPPKTAPNATTLYRAANDARRAGRNDAAIQAYGELQRRFPGSSEARASRVSLGGLLLRSSSAGSALAQFDAYLDGGGGNLAAEALFGRGRALRALGRTADEARNWERLVRQYPDSAYATHARRRIDELR